MVNGFAILLLILAGVLLIYAAIQGRTKAFGMVGRNYAVEARSEEQPDEQIPGRTLAAATDKKIYAVSFAKILAGIGLVLALGGFCGLQFGNGVALGMMAAAFVLLVVIGKRRSGNKTRG